MLTKTVVFLAGAMAVSEKRFRISKRVSEFWKTTSRPRFVESPRERSRKISSAHASRAMVATVEDKLNRRV